MNNHLPKWEKVCRGMEGWGNKTVMVLSLQPMEGEWKGNDFHGQGTMISTDGTKWVGDFRGNKPWNLSLFDKKGNINMKWVNGKKQ